MRAISGSRWSVWLMTIGIAALSMAACGKDSDGRATATQPPTQPAATLPGNPLASGGLSLEAGTGLNPSLASGLPGCSDPDDEACPVPLMMDLDGEITAAGITVRYPARYFDAAPAEGDIVLTITPSQNNRFAERAVFAAYFAESVDAALATLDEPESADWQAGDLTGKIGVTRDQTQDPPVNTTIGAFALADGRAVVLRLTTTGKYGWDLWSQVYAAMLDTLTVSPQGTP